MQLELEHLRAENKKLSWTQQELSTAMGELSVRLQAALSEREEMYVKLHSYEQHWFGS